MDSSATAAVLPLPTLAALLESMHCQSCGPRFPSAGCPADLSTSFTASCLETRSPSQPRTSRPSWQSRRPSSATMGRRKTPTYRGTFLPIRCQGPKWSRRTTVRLLRLSEGFAQQPPSHLLRLLATTVREHAPPSSASASRESNSVSSSQNRLASRLQASVSMSAPPERSTAS